MKFEAYGHDYAISNQIDRALCNFATSDSSSINPDTSSTTGDIIIGQQMDIEFWFKIMTECTESLCNIIQVGTNTGNNSEKCDT